MITAAFHLAKSGIRKVAVVERDSTYTYSSAMLSAGGRRIYLESTFIIKCFLSYLFFFVFTT